MNRREHTATLRTYMMWSDLSQHPEMTKNDWLEEHKPDSWEMPKSNDCYLCDVYRKDECFQCPLDIEGVGTCNRSEHPFQKWCQSSFLATRAEAAGKIANICWDAVTAYFTEQIIGLEIDNGETTTKKEEGIQMKQTTESGQFVSIGGEYLLERAGQEEPRHGDRVKVEATIMLPVDNSGYLKKEFRFEVRCHISGENLQRRWTPG